MRLYRVQSDHRITDATPDDVAEWSKEQHPAVLDWLRSGPLAAAERALAECREKLESETGKRESVERQLAEERHMSERHEETCRKYRERILSVEQERDSLKPARELIEAMAAESGIATTDVPVQLLTKLRERAVHSRKRMAAVEQERDARQVRLAAAQMSIATVEQERDKCARLLFELQGAANMLLNDHWAQDGTPEDCHRQVRERFASVVGERDRCQAQLSNVTRERDVVRGQMSAALGKEVDNCAVTRDVLGTKDGEFMAQAARRVMAELAEERSQLESAERHRVAAEEVAETMTGALRDVRGQLAESQALLATVTAERDGLREELATERAARTVPPLHAKVGKLMVELLGWEAWHRLLDQPLPRPEPALHPGSRWMSVDVPALEERDGTVVSLVGSPSVLRVELDGFHGLAHVADVIALLARGGLLP